ncbi:PP2C family protein-serine/threonine phosphatase [Streptomyces marincola]|uniref:PP2C family protein-serine/threonine phosphatase n=1 Tax=Streptomyces marincola TaxID=2878388 RepID=UPI001CF5F295|nr:GAF domain-containing SpoIIE family protein phosphatase [Streptomyces marincola]UCM91621.1 SpoIIE family protein phosphatase [Streptomyces marincola]
MTAGEQEAARLAAVRRYNVLDTPPDGAFDRIAALAARVFDVPVAAVTIVDVDRIWFKAAHGLDGVREIGREPGLCASAVHQDGALVIPDTLLDAVARGNPLVAGPMGIRFYAAAPLVTSEGHRLGTVNICDTKPRSISSEDVGLLSELAGIVMDELELRLSALQAVRHERERAAAQRQLAEAERAGRLRAEKDAESIAAFASTLQRALLPPTLPTVPGLELACHYHTASAHNVGGDFYDVFPLPDERWAFFLGDVCGKGPEAAALTSLVRHTLRVAAQHTGDPVAVLEVLNTALLENVTAGSRFCTAVFGTLAAEPRGGFLVRLATGGHPPAYHLRPAAPGTGTTTRVEAVRPQDGMLVGAFPQAHFAETDLRLAPGETLLLYTDGLPELRTGPDTWLGWDGLQEFLAVRPAAGATQLVRETIDLLDTRTIEGAEDDVALLAMSVPSTSHDHGRVGPPSSDATAVAASTHARSDEP